MNKISGITALFFCVLDFSKYTSKVFTRHIWLYDKGNYNDLRNALSDADWDVSNYRPISLLNTIGKVFEKIVHKHVFNFFRDNNILTSLQSGFVPGDSTVNQLVDLYNTFCKALDDGKSSKFRYFALWKSRRIN